MLAEDSIDVVQGLRYFGGDEDIFYQMLSSFDTMTLNESVVILHKAWKNEDYETVDKESFKLKGGAE